MEEIFNEYIIVTEKGKTMGCFDLDTVNQYLYEFIEEKILKYCEADDLEYEYLSPKKQKEIRDEIGYRDEENRVYKTKKVVAAIRKSEMDDDIKAELMEKLMDFEYELYLCEYYGLKEIFDAIEEVSL